MKISCFDGGPPTWAPTPGREVACRREWVKTGPGDFSAFLEGGKGSYLEQREVEKEHIEKEGEERVRKFTTRRLTI